MERLNAAMAPAPVRPVKVLQFGEGNFLRAFVDYMIDIANEKSDFNGSVALVKADSDGYAVPGVQGTGLPLHGHAARSGGRSGGGG